MMGSSHPAILVVGLGNPILGDDGAGWRVAEWIHQRLEAPEAGEAAIPAEAIEVDCLSLGGLSLMERLVGYRRVIIVDAVNSGSRPIGSLVVARLEELPAYTSSHTASAHDTSLLNALQVGRLMGADLPDEIMVVGIESPFVYDFTEKLSAPVTAAIPQAGEEAWMIMRRWVQES
ncbi:MAG: hydrogenase maturation protease [Anaerolineales bacterium]|nr:hydrogenase maturation protease [Anaerolineales bacterium]